jgi:predicted MPP superfamily phosphohydrolase
MATIEPQHYTTPQLDLVTERETTFTTLDELSGALGRLTTERPERHPLDPARLVNNPAWLGVGAAAAGVGALALKLAGRRAAAGMGALGLAGAIYSKVWEPSHPTLEHVTLRFPTLPPALDGLRIGQITDTHLGLRYTAENLRWAVGEMQRAQPDLIAVTGDLAGLKAGVPLITPLLRDLRAPLGVYAVPGNHDYWEGLGDVQGALALAGIPLLMNQNLRMSWRGADFWLAGVDDVFDGRPDFVAASAGIPAGAFSILLAHAPDLADNALGYGFALQLSGHSHGGHLRLPQLGAYTHPRYGARYVMGHYRAGDMQIYVSRGLGGTPLRWLCRPEATIFTLRRGG